MEKEPSRLGPRLQDQDDGEDSGATAELGNGGGVAATFG